MKRIISHFSALAHVCARRHLLQGEKINYFFTFPLYAESPGSSPNPQVSCLEAQTCIYQPWNFKMISLLKSCLFQASGKSPAVLHLLLTLGICNKSLMS